MYIMSYNSPLSCWDPYLTLIGNVIQMNKIKTSPKAVLYKTWIYLLLFPFVAPFPSVASPWTHLLISDHRDRQCRNLGSERALRFMSRKGGGRLRSADIRLFSEWSRTKERTVYFWSTLFFFKYHFHWFSKTVWQCVCVEAMESSVGEEYGSSKVRQHPKYSEGGRFQEISR